MELHSYVVAMKCFHWGKDIGWLPSPLYHCRSAAVCLTSCWCGITLHIQDITQRDVSARLWNARAYSRSVYKYCPGSDVHIAWGLVAVAYGGHCYWVWAVCDITLWRQIHVSNPTFGEFFWHNSYHYTSTLFIHCCV